jgi:aspartate kinase
VERLQEIAEVTVIDNQCIVAVVGRDLMRDATVGARIFASLHGVPMSMFSLGTSGLNLSIVMDDEDADRAVTAIHRALFEEPDGRDAAESPDSRSLSSEHRAPS